MTAKAAIPSTDKIRLGETGPLVAKLGYIFGIIGVGGTAALILAAGDTQASDAWRSVLLNFAFFLSLALGGLFFTIIQHITRAGWSVVVRRVAEAVSCNVLLMLILLIPILWFGADSLYHHWLHPGDDPLLKWKAPYLNLPFFLGRVAFYFIAWVVISRYFFNTSVRQDETGDPNLTLKMEARSPVAVIVFALSITFCAIDLLMSLEPHWFSTMFGVYYFAGTAGSFFALSILMLMFLQARGLVAESVTKEHYHDLGKLMFAFVIFWTYIAYSQFMLIWYANIPEETYWFKMRMTGQWGGLSLFLLFGHFIGPFLFLMSRWQKRRQVTLMIGAIWMLMMHWLDMFWLVKPAAGVETVRFSALDLVCFVGMGGLFLGMVAKRLQDVSLVPEKDPRLGESLGFQNF